MMNLALVKSENFGDVKCDFWRSDNEEILMTAEQLASVLGYSSKGSFKSLLSRNEYIKTNNEFSRVVSVCNPLGGTQETRVFTEDGIYEITMLAKTEKAKEFRAWVRKVLKGLRTNELTVQQRINLPTNYREAVQHILLILDEKEVVETKAKELEVENEELKPDAEGFKYLCSAENLQDMNTVAHSFRVGEYKLFEFLRNKKVLMKNNVPYRMYCEKDYFKVIVKTNKIGSRLVNQPQTLVKAKGYKLINRLLKQVNYKL